MLQRLQHAVHSGSRLLVANSSLQATVSSTQTRNVSRAYPDEPRVGVGVVVFRHPSLTQQSGPEVLLIQRGKEPSKGQWCFPGGSLELGETISDCAVREVLEETGISLLHQQQHQQQQQPSTATAAATAAATDSPAPPSSSTGDTAGSPAAANTPSSSSTSSSGPACEREVPRNLCRQPLHHPTAFAAVDSVIRDAQDQIKYHYAIIEVAAVAAPDAPQPAAADDVDDVAWVPLDKLPTWPNLVPSCAELAAEAAERFDLTAGAASC